MSFNACIHHEGYVDFHEIQAIDYALLQKVAGSHVASQLQGLLQSRLPIQDPDLLLRCRNTVKLQNGNNFQSVTTNMGLVASGIPLGLSEVAYKRMFPRLEEKHLLPIRGMMEKSVIGCGLAPTTFAVVEQYQGDDDAIGIPDLAPECQFWVIYIKAQYAGIDFNKLQIMEKLRHDEKQFRLKAARAQNDIASNTGVTGVAKSIKASVEYQFDIAMAAQLEKKLRLLEAELCFFGQLLPNRSTDTMDSTDDETGAGDDGEIVVAPLATSEDANIAVNASASSKQTAQAAASIAPDSAALISRSKCVPFPSVTPKPLVKTTVHNAPPTGPIGTPFSSGANALGSTSAFSPAAQTLAGQATSIHSAPPMHASALTVATPPNILSPSNDDSEYSKVFKGILEDFAKKFKKHLDAGFVLGGDSSETIVDDDGFDSDFPSNEALDFSPSTYDDPLGFSPISEDETVPDFSSGYEADDPFPAGFPPNDEAGAFFSTKQDEADAYFSTNQDEADAYFSTGQDDGQLDLFPAEYEMPDADVDYSSGFESLGLGDEGGGGIADFLLSWFD